MHKILLVDDDDQIVQVFKLHLEDAGYECDTVGNGLEAIEQLHKYTYDALVTDIVMPYQEGISTITESKRLFPDMPIIAISGGGQIDAEEYLTAARYIGASAVLKKPFRASVLIELLQEML